MDSTNEIYSNSPLGETVFEIRFPGEPRVECNRDQLYERIRKEYSQVFIPPVVQGSVVAMEPYRFEKEDASWGVMLSINKMSVYCKKYEGFALFKKEALRLFSIFGELYKIKHLQRTGLRYINIIPFTRKNDSLPLQDYLNVKINLPGVMLTDFSNLNLIFVSKTPGGNITTRIQPMMTQDKKQEAIVLDFDYAKEDSLIFKNIEVYLDESHSHTKALFENLITDGYKKVIKGEGLL